jgi:trimeric autotransporter adhesin
MSSFRQQVSSSIRILGWNRDASARATHLKAADGNVPFATIERKSMSTKTSIKRAALVAVAALTLGGISAVSASATTYPGLAASTTTGANSVAVSGYSVTDTTSVSATVGTYVLETVTANAADSVYNITSTGGSISIASAVAPFLAEDRADSVTAGYAVNGNSIQWYTGAGAGLGGAFSGTATLTFAVYSATAGAQTLTVAGNSSAAVTQTITWGAAPAVSASNSKSILGNHEADTAANDTTWATQAIGAGATDSTTALPTTASTGAAAIGVLLKNDQANTSPIAGDSLTAVVTGNGLVEGTYGTAAALYHGGFAVAASSTTDASGYAVWLVSSNGGSGVATITISFTNSSGVSTVVATKTVTFYSSTVASLKATVNHAAIPAASVNGYTYAGGADVTGPANSGAYSTTVLPAVSLSVKDSNGNGIPGSDGSAYSGVTVTSSNTTVATVATNPKYSSVLSTYYPVITPVAEGTTTLTFADALTGAITATAVVNVTKAVISSVATATDASSYDPATPVKYTITAKDAAGNAVPDGTYTGFFASGYEPTSNIAMQNFAVVDTLTTTAGVETVSFYAPVTPGTNVTITAGTMQGTAGAAAAATAFQVAALNGSSQGAASFTVNGGSDASGAVDAANAATDAANAAADAADNATQAASEALAAVNSLATTVASLIAGIKAQITSLTNLITKIKNKVGA